MLPESKGVQTRSSILCLLFGMDANPLCARERGFRDWLCGVRTHFCGVTAVAHGHSGCEVRSVRADRYLSAKTARHAWAEDGVTFLL